MEVAMDSSQVAQIVASNMSVSDKIRALATAGYPRADIARLLNKRYQHVRNVLEADKLHGGERSAAGGVGVAEPPRRFEGASPGREVEDRGGGYYRLVVREDGSVVLPAAVREAFGIRGRGAVIAKFESDEFKLHSLATGSRRIDQIMAPYRQDGVSWADELIAERRREAAREERDD
jgi:bifunctional DNA-binding transcriptional regulator/antitoxin component of YhaV-PrlF toxin-antitoxin module